MEESIAALEKYLPDVRAKIDWKEAATPRTIERYTTHVGGTAFGTKFEGLKVSMDLPEKLPGLYHAGSVGIIMSGWLGTINYGVIRRQQDRQGAVFALKAAVPLLAQMPASALSRIQNPHLAMTSVTDLIPHRPPFLFVDEIVSETARNTRCCAQVISLPTSRRRGKADGDEIGDGGHGRCGF